MSQVPASRSNWDSDGRPESPTQGLSDVESSPVRPRVFDSGASVEDSSFDLYNVAAVSALSQEPPDSFYSKYAEGKWNSTETPEIPAEFLTAMTPFRRLESSRIGFPSSPGMPPPDLTQSVEDAYRTFISSSSGASRSRRTSHSTTLLTPESEINHFSFGGTGNASHSEPQRMDSPVYNIAQSTSTLTRAGQPGQYTVSAARRYAEVGFLEPPMPPDEIQRRRAVRSFKPFNRKLDPNLDRIARIGKSMFAANASLISLVDTDEVQFSFNGKDPYMVPRGTPMCSHTVLLTGDQPLIVLDTMLDWRFKGNKVVTDELDVRFYAGVPVRTEEGRNVGVFCVVDNKPRTQFSEDDRAQLKELGAMTMRELQGRAQQQETRLRDNMQNSIEAFNRDAVSTLHSVDQLLNRAVEYISDALSMEGVLLFDAIHTLQSKSSSAEPQLWQDRNGVSLPVLASSSHARLLSDKIYADSRSDVTEIMFQDYPDGLIYTEEDEPLPMFLKLLPEGVTAGAAVPVFRGPGEPFALICVYTLDAEFYFRLPKLTLSFLRNIGLVLSSVQQKQVLSQADKAKVDFIANISHELRTPLHGVMASCDLLSETSLSDTQESFLSTAKQCASTINHVLDFAKSNFQATGQKRTPVDLAQLVEETLIGCWWGRAAAMTTSEANASIGEIYAPQSPGAAVPDRKGSIEPIIDIEPLPNWVVMIDKAGLRRILINLIGNSMKFTQGGYVKVGLYRGEQTDPSIVPIEIVVEDTGVGMSEKFIREKLFHPFSQERPFAQGIGLGLAIVRSILKSSSIDGTVDVQSQVGFGTRMVITLQAPASIPSSGPTWIRNPAVANPGKLLTFSLLGFSEESPSISQVAILLRKHLQRWYGGIVETDPSKAGILIVNGDVIHPEILNSVKRVHQKILVLSSSPIDPILLNIAQQLSLNGGFCLVTLKPVGPHALARLLSKMVDPLTPRSPMSNLPNQTLPSPHGGRSAGSLSRRLLSPPPTSPSLRSTLNTKAGRSLQQSDTKDETKPRALVVEDNPINRKVLSAYLKKRGLDFEEAENGAEGLNMFNRHPAGYFDICLMDLQMPVMDGFQATAGIRRTETQRVAARAGHEGFYGRIKVYALSGLAAAEDKERAASIGFDGYLVKPVSFKTLDAVFQALPPVARWKADA